MGELVHQVYMPATANKASHWRCEAGGVGTIADGNHPLAEPVYPATAAAQLQDTTRLQGTFWPLAGGIEEHTSSTTTESPRATMRRQKTCEFAGMHDNW